VTHPNLLTWILSAWVCLAAIAFVIAHMMLLSKRLVEWFDRLKMQSNPPSVQQTLNVLNITADDVAKVRSKRPDAI
jgi:hypothetical protein